MQKGTAFKMLNILHKALLMGQILLAAVFAWLIYSKTITPAEPELDKILQVAALIMAGGGIYAGMVIFKKKLLQIREMQGNVKDKLDQYRAACLVQWALLEGPSIFSSICFFVTGNYAFLALTAVIIFLFVMMGPSKLKMQLQLQLSESDLDEL